MVRLYNGARFPMHRPSLDNVELIDHGALPMITAMQMNGMAIDRDYFRDFSAYLKTEEERISNDVTELVGVRINVASPDQVADLLFRRLGIKPRFQPKMVPSGKREIVDDEMLESLKDYHPVVPMIQEFRECWKIRTSFADVLPVWADKNDRIHGNIRTTRVVTGRLSMTEPNLMAQPVRTDLGKRIRDGFKAPKGRLLGTIDLSQIQMRVVAHEAQCMNMLDIFLRDGDIHSENASRMFNLPVEKLDKMYHRYPAKRVGFGVVFMITAKGLQDQLVVASDDRWTPEQRKQYIDFWTEARCDQMINDWYVVNWEVKSFMEDQKARARRFGEVWSLMGRMRRIPGVYSVHRHVKADAEREAGNSPIQMGEVDIMKTGMCEIWDVIESRGWDCMPLIQVHDELVFECDDNLPEYLKEFKNIFANSVPLDAPIKSSAAWGDKSWADLEK